MTKIHTSQQHFAQVPAASIERSKFDRSCGHKTTFDAGFLIPIFVDEALPGDTFNLSMTAFARLATPLFPIMDNLWIDTFWFFVPNRLIWDDWEHFCGAQDAPGDSTDFLVPEVAPPVGGWLHGSMLDHMGVPALRQMNVNALHPRAYNLIYNEWFRDENLCTPAEVHTGAGPDQPALYPLQKRGKRRDYFTSCLTAPQKGPSVEIGIAGTAPVVPASTTGPEFRQSGGQDLNLQAQAGTNAIQWDRYGYTGSMGNVYWENPDLEVDLSTATAATINQLREAFAVQRIYERDARGGTRYVETLKAHWGVTSPDFRLQRPEYLGGHSSPINITPVAQGAPETSAQDTAKGSLAGFGTAVVNDRGFTKSFTEHGVIIGIACLRADLNYQQGLERMWSRRTRFDYAWPALNHLGEQAVLNQEIFAQGQTGTPAEDTEVFGYQERYAEYRYKPSVISNQMRSDFAQSLDTWHVAQDFASLPALNCAFIEEDPPIDRVIAVPSEPHLLWDCKFNLKCARPMPTYAVPGLIDHF